MATTTYSFGPVSPDFTLNNVITAGQQSGPAVASNAAGTRFLGTWTSNPGQLEVMGRFVNRDGTPVADETSVSPFVPQHQLDGRVAGLTGGGFIAAYTDENGGLGGNIRARLFNANGSPADILDIATTSSVEGRPDVTGLADGGFAVSWTQSTAGDHGTVMSVYNANGSLRHAPDAVNNNPASNTDYSSIAGLAGGGFVVVWEEWTGVGGDTEVRYRRFDANGLPLDGTDSAGVLIDTIGSVNRDIQVAGLPDGGFAVAYVDNGWGNGTDITARVFNADGTARGGPIYANSAGNGGIANGDQVHPTLTVLPNGNFIVGWVNGQAQVFQAYNSAGTPLGLNSTIKGNVVDGEIAALNSGVIAHVWRSSITDGSGDSIHTALQEFARLITGDGSSETIVGINDGIWEVLRGMGGDDILEGKAGRDTLEGGAGGDFASYRQAPAGLTASLINPEVNTGDAAGDTYTSIENLAGSDFDDVLVGNAGRNILRGHDGDDRLIGGLEDDSIAGGSGDDTAAFGYTFGQYRLTEIGDDAAIAGPEGKDTLVQVEHLEFADATLDVADDGNPFFDTLYYLSHNNDVFWAGVDPIDHFNAFGWQEGRDPNAWFDTSGYLAVNKDVPAGMNPVDHYHQIGWQEGRDPGPWFDTTLYLLRNPDVAAAGIDPLAHFLASGYAEGRAAYQAIGQNITGGFDAQYYLFHNPDVAAAGVDPLFHFNAVGWQEGRNPNAWFDTAGYLAHYTDVAAAGINPLQHYEINGWKEGRDPSASFDTLGYLAANPDVAAANYNPLDHFLQHGIYEGRQAVNDGMWS